MILPSSMGLGLRPHYYKDLLTDVPTPVRWFEVISENYMFSQGRPREILAIFRDRFPIAAHGVSLSIGSTDPVDRSYLKSLKRFFSEIEPSLVSDHLCWGGLNGENLHDLLPIPLNRKFLKHLIPRVQFVQEYLGRQFCLENVSSYVEFKETEMTEWDFLDELASRTGCGILLDINNVYVNAVNHGFDAFEFLRGIRIEHVKQFHIAGHSERGHFLFDTHDHIMAPSAWKLFSFAIQRFQGVPTLLEWDQGFPPLETLIGELRIAQAISNEPKKEIFHENSIHSANI